MVTRRSLLKAAGTSLSVALAGCAGLLSSSGGDGESVRDAFIGHPELYQSVESTSEPSENWNLRTKLRDVEGLRESESNVADRYFEPDALAGSVPEGGVAAIDEVDVAVFSKADAKWSDDRYVESTSGYVGGNVDPSAYNPPTDASPTQFEHQGFDCSLIPGESAVAVRDGEMIQADARYATAVTGEDKGPIARALLKNEIEDIEARSSYENWLTKPLDAFGSNHFLWIHLSQAGAGEPKQIELVGREINGETKTARALLGGSTVDAFETKWDPDVVHRTVELELGVGRGELDVSISKGSRYGMASATVTT